MGLRVMLLRVGTGAARLERPYGRCAQRSCRRARKKHRGRSLDERARSPSQRVELACDTRRRSEPLDRASRGLVRVGVQPSIRGGGIEQVGANLGEDPSTPATPQQAGELLEVFGDRVHNCGCEAVGANTESTALRNARQLATRSLTAAAPLCESA